MFKKIHLYLIALICFSYTSIAQQENDTQIEIVTQEKIQGIITFLTYSPNGQLIASGSSDETSIKVWDVTSGKIIGKLEGHKAATTALQFNEDGTALISSAKDNKVVLWSVVNWNIIDSTTSNAAVHAFVRNPNQVNSFYSGNSEGQVQQWEKGKFNTPTNLYSHTQNITTIDAHGTTLVTGDAFGKVTVFDLKNKKELVTEKIHLGAIQGLNFFKEGQGLITAGTNGKIHLWDINDLSDSKHFNASPIAISAYDANVAKNKFVTASQNTIKVWNLDGELLHEFKTKTGPRGSKEPVKAIKISPDGSAMASSGFKKSASKKSKENKNVIRIWDLNRGTLYASLEGSVNPIYTFDFHPISNELVTLGDDNILTFWDFSVAEKNGELELEKIKRELEALQKKDEEILEGEGALDKVASKGNRLKSVFKQVSNGNLSGAIGNTSEQRKNIGAGIVKRMFKERSIIKYSQKGTYLITKQKKDEIRLYEFENGTPVYQQPLFSRQPSINQLQTSPDEKHLVVLGGGDSAVSIIDLETRRLKKKLYTPAPSSNLKLIYEANSVAFSPDGSLLAVCFNTSKTFVYNTTTWELVFENLLPNSLGYVESPFVNFSKDGKFMVVKSVIGLKKYNTSTFSILGSQELKINGYSAPMDKPQDYAITIKDEHIYFENLFTGDVQKSIHVKPDQITHISINPQGLVGITFSSGQFQLLNPETGTEEVLLVAEGDNYIFKTAENFYKVSKEGYDLVTFRIGNQAFPFEQFDAIFNRPDLVLKKMGCTDTELMSLYEKAYLKRIKKLGLQPTTKIVLNDIPKAAITNGPEIPAITVDKKVLVDFNFSDRKNLKSYNIWVNNVPVHGKKGKSISGTTKELSEEIELIFGINKIQISCNNESGYESLIQTFYIEKEGEVPPKDLYLVTIGTSDYKDSRYDLTYPVKDGEDLIKLMESNPSNMYQSVKTRKLFDTNVTAENIKGLRDFLNTSKPNDVVIVFVAGHGILDANFDYYFGTHNIDFTDPSKNGLAYDKLEHILDGIKANKKILIMDTCHSGEVDKEDVFFAAVEDDPGENDKDISFRAVGAAVKQDDTKATPTRLAGELFNDLRKGTGTTVISSAGGAEYAMESDEWKNGLFTYCMLNGLKNRTADLDGDGVIMLLELQEYVVDQVRKLSHGRQVPNSRIQNIELDFPIW